MSEATDDECIAIAVLHGLEPYHCGGTNLWYVSDTPAPGDQIYRTNDKATGFRGFKSRELLARAYCKHHNLLR